MFAVNTFFRDGALGRKRRKRMQTKSFAHKKPKILDDRVPVLLAPMPTASAVSADGGVLPVAVDATFGLDLDGPAVVETETSSVQPPIQSKTKSNNDDEYRRAKKKVYYDLEKIPTAHINEDLMNFLRPINKNGKKQGSKKIFKMCYKTLNNVEEAKKMTNQLAIKPYVDMGLKTFNNIGLLLKSSLHKDVSGKVKKCYEKKILNQIIYHKFIELFGVEYYELDNKTLKEVSYVPRAHKKLKIREETDVGNERLSCVISVDSLNPSFNFSDWQNDQDDVDFNITASKIDDLAKSIAEYYSKIKQNDISLLNKSNLKKEISKIINKKHNIYSSDVIENLGLYFSNDDFLSKSDKLWESNESNLIGELIVKLISMFSNMKYNMAYLTSCLVCVFKDIVKISSIPSEKLLSQFHVFFNTIKKHVKHNDSKIWKTWFVSTMFLDWCLVLAHIFMPDKKITSFDETIILNAKKYFKKIKHEYYVFGNRGKSSKIGIFEFSKKEDLLDIGHPVINSHISEGSALKIVLPEPIKKPEEEKKPLNPELESKIKRKSLVIIEPQQEKEIIPEKSKVSNVPVVVKEHAVVEEPTVVKEHAVVEESTVVKEHAVVEEPTVVKEYTIIEEPAVVKEYTIIEEPAVIEKLPAVVEEPALINESSKPVKKPKPTEVPEADRELHKPVKKQNCIRKSKVISEVEQVKKIKSKRSYRENKKKMKNIFIPEENKGLLKSLLTKNETNPENKVKKFVRVRSEFSFSNSFQNSKYSIIHPQYAEIKSTNQSMESMPKQLLSNIGTKTTQNEKIEISTVQAATTVQNEPLAFFTIPDNPQKFPLTNSTPNVSYNANIQPQMTNRRAAITNTSGLYSSISSNSISNQSPDTFFPSATYQGTSTQRNNSYNGNNNGVHQPYLISNTTMPTNKNINYYGSVTSYQPNTQFIQPNNTTLLHRPPLSSTITPNSMPPNSTVLMHQLSRDVSVIEGARPNAAYPLPYKIASSNGTHHSGMLHRLPSQYPITSNVGTYPRYNKNVQAPLRPNDKTLRAVSTNVISAVPRSCLKPCCSAQKSVIFKPSVTNSSTANAYQAPVTHPLSPDLPNSLSPNMPHQPNSNSRSTMKCSNECCSFITNTDHFDPYVIFCCLNASYCSVGCQLADWERHRVTCFSTKKFNVS